MAVAQHDFEGIGQGEVWRPSLTLQNSDQNAMDLTGRVVQLLIEDGDQVIADIRSTGTSTGGTITVTPADGVIDVDIPPATTASISTASWALWLDPGTDTADCVVTGGVRTVKVPRRA